MKIRRAFLVIASFVLAAALVAVLIRTGKIDLHLTLLQLRNANRMAFTKLVLLNSLLIFFSAEKWLRVDAVLRHESDSAPSKSVAFGLTSAGMALGFLLPVQLGMAAARTLGTYFYGRAFRRGTAGTLFEQAFDLLIVCFIGVASVLSLFFHGQLVVWMILAVAMTALALLVVRPSMRALRWLAVLVAVKFKHESHIRIGIGKLEGSGMLSVPLAQRLVILSALRFGVIVLMAGETAQAVGARISLWQLGAAIPFVVLATAISITPGGLGVNELTYSGALHLFGTPFSVAAQWSLANRLLGMASCFIVASLALTLAIIKRIVMAPASIRQITDAANGTQIEGPRTQR